MTSLRQRERLIGLVDEAVAHGARRHRACRVIGLSVRTLQRWRSVGETAVQADGRPTAVRPAPAHRLTDAERKRIVEVSNISRFANLPPSQIVPKLADEGEYLASESSFYRVLKDHDQVHHRGSTSAPRKKPAPTTHVATAPNQVWTWDVTWLPSEVRGRFYYLYLISDLFSRYGVHWEVHERECGTLAAELIEQAIWREKCQASPPVLHSDNNAFIESLFRTLKHGPIAPPARFRSIEQARQWVARFMAWYNHEHQHSSIRFVTPAQRHRGDDIEILTRRDAVYAQARERHPRRWTGSTRNWRYVDAVALNPDQKTRGQIDRVA